MRDAESIEKLRRILLELEECDQILNAARRMR
jgi:hypothetical protein